MAVNQPDEKRIASVCFREHGSAAFSVVIMPYDKIGAFLELEHAAGRNTFAESVQDWGRGK